ncbi:MAG: Rab family GTPase [Promethearchaeota archaeon]
MSGDSYIFKVIVAGAGGVGKTALVNRFATGKFQENYLMTIGSNFLVKEVTLDTGEHVKLSLWDFAGEKRFRFLLPPYTKGASGALLCYDITDYATFEEIPEWLRIVRENAGMIPIILVGTKYDLPNHEVDLDTANEYAEKAKCIMNVWCSSKTGVNVEAIFEAMAKWLIYYVEEGA